MTMRDPGGVAGTIARAGDPVTIRYLDYRLAAATVPAGPAPVVVYLHGAGEKGADIAQVRGSALPRLIADGLDIPVRVIAPQCPPGASWPVERLEVLLDWLLIQPDVDPRRIHLTGISMGARGAWDLAYRRADALASLVAVCGYGVPTLAPWVKRVPTWLVHGADDDIVPPARSAEMAAALQAEGAAVRYTELPGAGHDCGARVYADPAVWDWILQQRRA